MTSQTMNTESFERLGVISKRHSEYCSEIITHLKKSWTEAEAAHLKGFDPSLSIESTLAYDLADRVERLLGLPVASRLRNILTTEGSTDRAALTLAEEIALGKFGYFEKEEALDWGVRIGLAVVTDGVTIAPLQGISSVKIKKNTDGSNYASIYFAGPIRSAGGTEAAFTLVIADKLRTTLGLEPYRCVIATDDEVGRFIEELRVYERQVGNFQYKVSDEDIRTTMLNLPVEINGVETDPVEVIVHRAMKRIETDRVRGGALRVLNDGIIGRSRKLAKLLKGLSITGWDWLAELKGGAQRDVEESRAESSHFREIISGRPVLSFPGRVGGFRLRYGRSYNTGLSVVGLHPYITAILDYPVVVGTQVKLDIPGKAATIAFVDTIESPIVKLIDGSIVRVDCAERVTELRSKLKSVLFLGDILISYGDFLENNVPLPPTGYVEELWIQDVKAKASNIFGTLNECAKQIKFDLSHFQEILYYWDRIHPSCREAFALSEQLGVPLHPRYLFYWDLVQLNDVIYLRNALRKINENSLSIDISNQKAKEILELLGVPHHPIGGNWVVEGEDAEVLAKVLRLNSEIEISEWKNVLQFLTKINGIEIKRKSSVFVGVRVGRPEKAMLRKMKPPVHVLFPVGNFGGAKRDLLEAARTGEITIDLINIVCSECGTNTNSLKCPKCGGDTKIVKKCPNCNRIVQTETCLICRINGLPYTRINYPLKQKIIEAEHNLGIKAEHPLKGVKGLSNYTKIPELIEKGILRRKFDLSIYKDGTVRFDVTNASLTHFRPLQISTPLEKLTNLGYTHDIYHKPLTEVNQTIELFVQDVILPLEAGDCLLKVSRFIDELLVRFYKLDSFYNAKEKSDLLGQLIVGLAPHTSVGIIGRLIGFTNSQVCFAHPYWHSAKRRDCDGDGDSIMLLLDILLNFSKDFLPEQIGGWMDAPLLLQPLIIPQELQRQALNFDIASSYPTSFYEATAIKESPQKLSETIDIVKRRIGTEKQFEDMFFTHNTQNISLPKPRSAYSTLKSLREKLEKQIELAKIIRAVGPEEVVTSVLKTHLLPDIIGNMNAYTSQEFRCKSCGTKFRRIPMTGTCLSCNGDLLPTVTRGSVEKYVELASELFAHYTIDEYLRKRFEVINQGLSILFPHKKNGIQKDLTKYFDEVSKS